jgi:hypothetical protein
MATLEEILAANEAKRLGTTPEQIANEPGWFQPGSKSEAVVRGAADTASMGLGKVVNSIVSPLWSSDPNKSYWENVKSNMSSEQQANNNAADKNPGSYVAGSVVGGIPQALGIVRAGNIAAQGVSQFPLIARALGMGTTGAAMGGVHGATEAPTPSEIPSSAKKEALVGGVINSAIPFVGKAFTGAKNIISGNTQAGVVNAIKEVPTNTQAKDIGNAVASSISKQVSIPALGALAGMGYKNTMSGEKPDWSRSWPDAVVQTGVAGAQGAALGTAAKWGTKLVGAGKDEALYQGGRLFDKAGKYIGDSTIGKLATEGTAPNPLSGSFSKIKNFISGPKPVAGTEGQSPEVIRKAAMDAATSSEGRSATNTDSPLTKKMEENASRYWEN